MKLRQRRRARGFTALLVVALTASLSPVAGAGPRAAAAVRPVVSAQGVVQVAAGSEHTCALIDDGSVRCFGSFTYGQSGGTSPTAPVDLGSGRTATALAAGSSHTCAVLDDGSVKCWGRALDGRLGLGDIVDNRGDQPGEMGDALPAVALGSGRTAITITAGEAHTCALLDNGAVKCWGNGSTGQLGLGSTASRGTAPGTMGDSLPPVDLGTGRTATAITAGGHHTCALLDNVQLKCWGWNGAGQLGTGVQGNRGDAPGEMGDFLPAVALGTGRTAVEVALGAAHTCALLDDATAKCWGENDRGRLGLGDQLDRGDGGGEMGDALPTVDLGTGRTATSISIGDLHSCAVLDDGSVTCWGGNVDGQSGSGDWPDLGDGPGEMGDALAPIDLGTGRTGALVEAGDDHTCAVLDDDSLKCWGRTNGRGNAPHEMGDYNAPVDLGRVGAYLSAVFTADQRAVVIGQPVDIHLTLDNIGTETVTGITVTDPVVTACRQPVPTLPPGASHTLDCSFVTLAGDVGLFTSTATVDTAQTAAQPAVPVDVHVQPPVDEPAATVVAAGSLHTCAVLVSGAVKCWGAGGDTLGLGDANSRGDSPTEMGDLLPAVDLGTGRTATALDVGGSHTCAILDNGSVKCWGWNDDGQLGVGDTTGRGGGPGEMGDALPAVDLGTGRTATAVTLGHQHTCALLDTGAVTCWGRNEFGQLGLGDTANRGDGAGEMGDALPTVDLGTGRTATSLAAGSTHTCALLDNGSVKCWGRGADGTLGLGDEADRGDGVGEMGDALPVVTLGTGRTATTLSAARFHSCALLDNGSVKCWGSGGSGELGQGDSQDRGDGPGEMGDTLAAIDLGTAAAEGVATGEGFGCALLDGGTVRCWGDGADGRTGSGDQVDRGDGPGEMGGALAPVDLGANRTAVAIRAGGAHACAVLDDATVKCWGFNSHGQLGQGDHEDRGDEPAEMGDNLPPIDLGTAEQQPDLEVKLSGRAFTGGGIHGRDPAPDQVVAATRRQGATAVFYVRIANVGDRADTFDLRRIGTGPGETVRYFRGRTATDLTGLVVARTYRTRTLHPGESVLIRVEATVRTSVPDRAVRSITLRSKSQTDPTGLDTVRATVNVV